MLYTIAVRHPVSYIAMYKNTTSMCVANSSTSLTICISKHEFTTTIYIYDKLHWQSYNLSATLNNHMTSLSLTALTTLQLTFHNHDKLADNLTTTYMFILQGCKQGCHNHVADLLQAGHFYLHQRTHLWGIFPLIDKHLSVNIE